MATTKIISPDDLRRQVLKIEDGIGTIPMTPCNEKKLFRRLDSIQSSVELLQKQGNTFLEDLLEKITQLYGAVHNRVIDTLVFQIVNNAQYLQSALEEGKEITSGVDRLKVKIQQIRQAHALGETHSKITSYISQCANRYSQMHSLGEHPPQLINQFNLLELQREDNAIDADLVGELFELAERYYFGNHTKDLLKRYHLLPGDAKQRIKMHFAKLGITSPSEDPVKAAQSFIAAANDLTMGEDLEPYYSTEELQHLFTEAHVEEYP